MKRRIIIIAAILLLVPIVIYFAFPGVLYNFSISSARKSAGLSKKIIKVDNNTISYLDGGKGDTILMLHGFGGNKDHWTKFSKSLTTNFHVVAIDLPGFGESSKIETESYNIDSQVKKLSRIIDVLRLNKFHLVGNSMGGTIAGRYTAVVPDKVLSLALFDTGGIPQRKRVSM
jgi:pimeloyl-ACP methyl ester carboxylesterase